MNDDNLNTIYEYLFNLAVISSERYGSNDPVYEAASKAWKSVNALRRALDEKNINSSANNQTENI